MDRERPHIFVDELTRFAEHTGDADLLPVIARLTAPSAVAVLGRAGVGRTTVAAALADAGVPVRPADPDVTVLVVAETVKPEDRAVLARTAGPALIVLNKADRTGLGGSGPMAQAQRRAAELRAVTGVPTLPLVGLLTGVRLDDELVAALQVLTGTPADLTSADAFRCGEHRLSAAVRGRLLDTLDRFGIAHAVLALRRGADPAQLGQLLRRVSGLDEVLAGLHTVAAPVRYRRLRAAIDELQRTALRTADPQLTAFLAADETVFAAMAAAVEVVQAAGLTVDPDWRSADDRTAHLRRAVHWRRYSRGPVGALHRSCGYDISRGSLRLSGRAPR